MKATRSSSIGPARRRSSSTSAAGDSKHNNNNASSEGTTEQQSKAPLRRSTREREQPQLHTPETPGSAGSPKSARSSRRRAATSSGDDPLAGSPVLPLTPQIASGAAVVVVAVAAKAKAKRQQGKQQSSSPSVASLPSPLLLMVPKLLAQKKNGKVVQVRVLVNGQVFQPTNRYRTTSPPQARAAGTKEKNYLGQDGNLFYCVVCHEFGDVVCCDGCPHVYHPKCLSKGSPSRMSLENDDDPWYCPDCMNKKTPPVKEEGRGDASSPRRTIKHRCQECRQKRPDLSLEPCKVCGVHVHHPSCLGTTPPPPGSSKESPSTTTTAVLCSSCRAEAALTQEEIERDDKKRLRIDEETHVAPGEAVVGEPVEETPVRGGKGKRRTRSMDEGETVSMAVVSSRGMEQNEATGVEDISAHKRKRTPSGAAVAEASPGEEGTPTKSGKKKKKKKKRKRDSDAHLPTEGRSSSKADRSPLPEQNDSSPFAERPPMHGPPTQATPAFHFYLVEQRPKVEKVLSRKHRYFNRLPKGGERNALIAKETAKQWIKLSSVDQKKYINESMRDYEERIIAWKNEKSIRDMLLAGETEGGEEPAEEMSVEDRGPDDAILTHEMYERLYLGTSVGSKPYKPEPNQSHNRVLLDLLRDMRFHPLPMFSTTRSEVELKGVKPSSKMVINHFDVHGPIATSVGDECMGCTRGWPHFCPVLQRRMPASVQRSKLQPAASALISSRVGLGLRPRLERVEPVETDEETGNSDGKTDLLVWREAKEGKDLKNVRFVPAGTLSDPSNRADDVVQFIEQVVAMRVPEPPKPTAPAAKIEATPKKSPMARGLPTRHKRPSDASTADVGERSGYENINKCGRCRTIIMNESGCLECRRAQMVILLSKRQPPASTEQQQGHQKPEKEEMMKVQTAMMCRVVTKEAIIGEPQLESDKKKSKALLKERWTPCAVFPPTPALAPSPSRRSVEKPEKTESSEVDHEDSARARESHGDSIAHEDGKGSSLSSEEAVTGQMLAEPSSELRPRNARRATKEPETFDNQDVDRQVVAKQFRKEADKVNKQTLGIACSGILLALMRRDPFLLFAQPVAAEGYLAVVVQPMDFGKIRSKVLNGSYQKLGAFVADARLLCENALIFNPPGSIYFKTARELLELLLVLQKRASKWINAIKNAHASFWRKSPTKRKPDLQSGSDVASGQTDDMNEDPFKELQKTWPEAVAMYENSDWLKNLLTADFTRTKENETAFYGSLAVRRAAKAAEVCLAPYTDAGGAFSAVVKRSDVQDEELRNVVDSQVAAVVDPVQLREISSGREESIVRLMRRVQSRRLERRIGSENGCARCDGMFCPEVKAVMNADVRWGRNKKKGGGGGATDMRVAQSRLGLTTGLASEKNRERIEKRREQTGEAAFDSNDAVDAVDARVSLRGSQVHGLGVFSEQFFRKGEVVCEYIGECVSLPVAEVRETLYQAMRIQDYQFRLDDSQIIDATMKGGLGRYVNHNCNPNCVTKIIPGTPPNQQHQRRVLIIAQRDIEPREELSYDYQFPLEKNMEARIPCNCQSDVCRGFMNWDLPEKGANTGAIRTQKRGANMRDRIRRLGRPLKK